MAQKPISMNQIRRIIQLFKAGTSIRNVARQCSMSRNTVRAYNERLTPAGSYEELLCMSDEQLSKLVFDLPETGREREPRFVILENLMPDYVAELGRTGVTRELLWKEYRDHYPQGYGYTQFCHYLSAYIARKDTVMYFLYRMGEKLMVDFAGKTMSYVDDNGEIIVCPVFVAVLPFSGYGYVEAVHSQKQHDLVQCLENSLVYIGGVTQCIISDNMKNHVKRSSRYEPEFTEFTHQIGVHYDTTLMATRKAKPRDKAAVEKAVDLTYQRIYAPLRNQVFRSLAEMNYYIRQQLEIHHRRPFRGGRQTREELMVEERKHLKPLPPTRLELKRRVFAKVQKNYHVVIGEDWHFYSVPYRLVGKTVEVVYTSSRVEIYLDHQRIAIHPRNLTYYGFSTNPDHRAPNHKAQAMTMGYTANDFMEMALKISPQVVQAIELVLQSRQYPEQTFNACLGILRLAKTYSPERLTVACSMSIAAGKTNYGFIENILKHNTDKLQAQQPDLFSLPKDHQNLRGPSAFQ